MIASSSYDLPPRDRGQRTTAIEIDDVAQLRKEAGGGRRERRTPWVLGYFLLLTIGELSVIPVGLTLVGALSPLQIAAMAMGAWYIAKIPGSLLAGAMGAYWGVIPATSFVGVGAASMSVAAVILLALSRARRVRLG